MSVRNWDDGMMAHQPRGTNNALASDCRAHFGRPLKEMLLNNVDRDMLKKNHLVLTEGLLS